MRWLFLALVFISYAAFTQCKTFRLTKKGDTLNCTDFNNNKQGKWTIHLEEVRGEPGYEEEGVFKNNLREGKWRRYTLMGDLMAIENYRWGLKDGSQQYYTLGQLEREESWRAIDPKKKFDTIDVPDLFDPGKITQKIMKVDAYAQKHGIWKYYRPGSLSFIRTETYLFDSLYQPVAVRQESGKDAEAIDTAKKLPGPKVVPKQVADFEKNNSKKKQIKIRDGKTGG